MNKQQLAARIWESANQMRSKIEANEYKDYILGFIFYKYLSDKLVRFARNEDFTDDDHRALSEEDPETVEHFKSSLGYFIGYPHLFSTWIDPKTDFDVSHVRDALSAFSRLIHPNHKRLFEGIFKTLETGLSKLGDTAAKQTKAISDLLQLIKDIPMDGRQGYDVLGFIYEYLISMFAANAGKKAGEFYTPHEVSVLMSEIIAHHVKDKETIQIYDSTSGSGSLLLNIGQSIARHMADQDNIKYFAQELKENTYIVSNEYLIAVGNSSISTEFLTLLAGLPDMRQKFFLSSYGVDIEKLFFDVEDWKKRAVTLPSIPEQTQIGGYFREVDRLIGLQQRKHDKLVTLKKAMLHAMFPQPGTTTPEIRFKGFEGEWEEKKLGDAMINVANNTLSRANLNYRSGLARNVHYGDVLIRFGEVLDAKSNGVPFISDDAVARKLKSSNLDNGDIVMADAAEDETVGKCTEIQNVGEQIVLAGLHTIALRPLTHFAPFYLGYYLNSDAFHGQLLPIMQGTKVLSISKTAIKQTVICFPTDKAEQQKIGAYFCTLDELISKHALQLEKLKQIKSACLERMFL